MRFFKLTLLLLIFHTFSGNAQVGIGTTNPNATLDIRSSNQASPSNTDGLLIPKIDNFPTANPIAAQDGMMVYLTGNGATAKGFYYWDNTVSNWIAVLNSAGWQETGNAGTNSSTNFIGTTDTQDLSFRTNNIEKIRLTQQGQLEFYNTGNSVFIGQGAGDNDNLSNNHNTFVGNISGNDNTTGGFNSFFGAASGSSNTLGSSNSFFGHGSGTFTTTGNSNSFFGSLAGDANTIGNDNSFFGSNSGTSVTTGSRNTATGFFAFRHNVDGSNNVAIGSFSLSNTISGNGNVAIGTNAGGSSTSNSKNNGIFIGINSGFNESNDNRLYIENSNSTNPLIYGEFDTDILRVNGTLQVNNPLITGYSFPNEDGTASQVLQTNGNGVVSFVNTNALDTNDWSKNGNAGTNSTTNFIGTTDAQDLSFRANNFEALRLSQRGQLEFINTGNSVFIGEDAGNNDDFSTNNNTFVGHQSGLDNSGAESEFNSFYGALSGHGFSGINNSYFGAFAGFATDGSNNSSFGFESGRNITGFSNSSFGASSGDTIEGSNNTLLGAESGNSVGGDDNTYLGYRAGFSVAGSFNTFIGSHAGEIASANAEANIFIGANTADNFIQGNANVTIGNEAMRFGEGNNNVVIGTSALNTSENTDNNVVIGNQALQNVDGAINSIIIGHQAGQLLTNVSERLIIHNSSSSSPLIYGEFDNQIIGLNGDVAINHQAPLAALHVKGFDPNNIQSVVGILEANNSNRPILLFAETPPSSLNDFSVGMSLEYNGLGSGASNKMVINGIGGDGLFEFQNGGDLNILNGDLSIGGTTGDRLIRMNDAIGNNDRVMLRQAGTDHIFIGDIDNNGGNFTIRTGGVNAMTVLSGSRNVGIGTTTPAFQLQLSTDSAGKPGSALWDVISDRRLKKDILSFSDGLETLKQINPVWFTYNGLAGIPEETSVGTIAQELQEVAPYLVKDWTYTAEDGTTENYLGVNYGPLTFIMVNAIKEQAEKIEKLEAELTDLKNRQETKLQALENRLKTLENN